MQLLLPYRELLDSNAQNEFSDVFRDVHSIVNRHSIPWDHDYVQCRLQNSLFAIANQLPYSSAICWEKFPASDSNVASFANALEEAAEIVNQQDQDGLDEDASIQYSPPNNNYADEVYYPPMKRRPDFMWVRLPIKRWQLLLPFNFTIFFVRLFFSSFSEFEINEQNAPNDYRQHYQVEQQLKNDEETLRTRVNDLKNRIELRRMLSEYESGALKPPIFYSDGIAEPEEADQPKGDDRVSEDIESDLSFFDELPSQDKRIVLSSQTNDFIPDIVDEIDTNYNEYPLKSLFREHQRPKYILENIGDNEFDNRNNDPNEYHRTLFKVDRPRIDESAVYTEGGLVYGPSQHVTSTQHRKRKPIIECILSTSENSVSKNQMLLQITKVSIGQTY